MEGDAPTTATQEIQHGLQTTTPRARTTISVDAVRHHWAPQFRPSSLPTPKATVIEQTNAQPPTLPQELQHTLLSSNSIQGYQVDPLTSARNIYPQFPLSTFLKDLSSPNDCMEYWLPKAPSTEPAPLPPKVRTPNPLAAALPVTPTQSAAAAAACCACVPSYNTALSSRNAIKTREALAPATLPTRPTSPQPNPSALPTLIPFSTTLGPLPVSTARPAMPMMQSCSALRPSRPSAPQRPPWGWQEVSEGIVIFRTSPSTFITAPVTSLHPFVYPPRPRTPTAVSKDFFKDTSAVPSMLRRRLIFSPPSPDFQKELNNFLGMGHANGCWCSSVAHPKARAGASPDSGTVDGPQALQVATKVYLPKSQESILYETSYLSQAPQDLPKLLDDVAGDSSDDDAVIVTRSSEGTSSSFKELFIIEGVSSLAPMMMNGLR